MKSTLCLVILLLNLNMLFSEYRGAKTIFLHKRDEQGTTVINNTTIPFIINQPGSYKFIGNICVDATTSTTLISIQTSNVKINLNGRLISQRLPSTRNITGIHIAPDLSNINIENGSINNINGTGIIIGQNCFNIAIHNMIIVQTGSGGIKIDPNSDTIAIHNCFIGKSLTSRKDNIGLLLDTVKNVVISQSSFVGVRAPAGYNAYNFYATGSNYCTIVDSSFNGAQGNNAYGIYLDSCNDFSWTNNEAKGNTATNGVSSGVHLNNSTSNTFEGLIASQNRASTIASGIKLESNSHFNKFSNVIVNNQLATENLHAYGVYTESSIGNIFSTIIAMGNTGGRSSSSEGAGIKLLNTIGNSIYDSTCSYNNGRTGKGYGILIDNATASIIENNKSYYNIGLAGGLGIKENGETKSNITTNTCFANQTNYDLDSRSNNNRIASIAHTNPKSITTSNKINFEITNN